MGMADYFVDAKGLVSLSHSAKGLSLCLSDYFVGAKKVRNPKQLLELPQTASKKVSEVAFKVQESNASLLDEKGDIDGANGWSLRGSVLEILEAHDLDEATCNYLVQCLQDADIDDLREFVQEYLPAEASEAIVKLVSNSDATGAVAPETPPLLMKPVILDQLEIAQVAKVAVAAKEAAAAKVAAAANSEWLCLDEDAKEAAPMPKKRPSKRRALKSE